MDKAILFSRYKVTVTSVLSLGDRSRKIIVGWIVLIIRNATRDPGLTGHSCYCYCISPLQPSGPTQRPPERKTASRIDAEGHVRVRSEPRYFADRRFLLT